MMLMRPARFLRVKRPDRDAGVVDEAKVERLREALHRGDLCVDLFMIAERILGGLVARY